MQETSNQGKCFDVSIYKSADVDVGHKNTPSKPPPKPPPNDRRQGQPPTASLVPKILSSFFSFECEVEHLHGLLLIYSNVYPLADGPQYPPRKSQLHTGKPQ